MRTKKILLCFIVLTFLMLLLLPVLMAESQHNEESGEFKHRISTEGLHGTILFLVNLYNDHRMIYALVTTAVMALSGGVIALAVDFFLARLGLTVSKMDHKE